MKRNKAGRTLEFLLLLVLPFLTHYLLPVMVVIEKPYIYLGIVLMIVGIVLVVKASVKCKKAGNNFDLKSKSSKLVISGIYSYSRNPMYLGMLLWLIGIAVLLGTLSPFIYTVVFFVLTNYMIFLEERKLEQVYGDEYLVYKSNVRRWI